MEKNGIFSQRKELKKKSHAVVRSHYAVLIFLMLVMIMFGTEYTFTTSGFGDLNYSRVYDEESALPADTEAVTEAGAAAVGGATANDDSASATASTDISDDSEAAEHDNASPAAVAGITAESGTTANDSTSPDAATDISDESETSANDNASPTGSGTAESDNASPAASADTVNGSGTAADNTASSGITTRFYKDAQRIGTGLLGVFLGRNAVSNAENGTPFQSFRNWFVEKADSMGALGTSDGVLAKMVNSFSSDKFFTQFLSSVTAITKSENAANALFIVLSMLFGLAVFVLLKNVYSAVLRRVFLEARVYEKVSFLDVLHFAMIKKWLRACWIMFVKSVYESLWMLTIIGYFIKLYSYAAVPYIVAENPSIGANQAITLSRRMMNGHKFELFKYQLTLFGWVLLGSITFGISDLVYGAAYRLACEGEFYARVRKEAIENGIEGTELLNDACLFEKADRIRLYETYFNVVDEITDLHENRIELHGVRAFFAKWFGIWLGTMDEKKSYDDYEGRQYSIQVYKDCMIGTRYPTWLNPLWKKKEITRQGHFTFIRNYSVWTLILLFFTFCIIGWTWEVAVHYMQTGEFANRGILLGPWLPIYGSGGLVVLLLCSRFRKNPVLEFFMATLLCGILEYFTAWYLETTYHTRWWSYDGYFLNLHGRICAEGLLVFGVGCCIVVYLAAPVFDFLVSKLHKYLMIGLCIVLLVLFCADVVHSSTHPNTSKGAVEEMAPEQIPAEG